MASIQSYVLRERPPARHASATYLLVNEEALPDTDPEMLDRRLSVHHQAGAGALLSINHEAYPEIGRRRRGAREIVLSTGLFELAQRTPQGLRQGFVEELYLRL